MTANAGSEIPVEPPQLEEPVVGLLAQVPVITGPEALRWFAGMRFAPEVAGAPAFRDLCSTAALAGGHSRFTNRVVHPFELVIHDRCSTFGWTEADYVGRATRALAVKRHWGVDREFEKGELVPGNLHLAATYTDAATPPTGPNTVTLAAGANVSPEDGLALLDEAIATSANVVGRGMIFATSFVVAKWTAKGLLETKDMEGEGRTTLLSPNGNYVVAGTGFEGRGPDGAVVAAHASQWAYATDLVQVVAADPETVPGTLPEATDKANNVVVYRQHQWFGILWAGLLHAAVKIATATPAVT